MTKRKGAQTSSCHLSRSSATHGACLCFFPWVGRNDLWAGKLTPYPRGQGTADPQEGAVTPRVCCSLRHCPFSVANAQIQKEKVNL